MKPEDVEPLDPDSESGKQVAATLTELMADVEERWAREKAEAEVRAAGESE